MDLFPHNKRAFESAARLFSEENKVCIIQPTGTGKSVIIAAFANQHQFKRHLLLAPGSHILAEVRKHLRNGDISFSTYIGLGTKDGLFRHNSFDFIYLDEFHRLGADVWGSYVERLLNLNPAAKVLGTSATPIRYLDDNRNMATEIFNDRIASQLSLSAAIAGGILPAPTYVSTLYSVKEEFQQMKKRLLSSNLKDKETIVEDLNSKIIDWENSSGLDKVIEKHLATERRRVIVFCKDWEHLKHARKILDPIFQKIYDHVECLSLYSKQKDKENENALRLFSGESDRVLVLYTIDKVNEGLHSKNCNTVVLFRDTISPIVFYQQIGRAFSINAVNRPLILDLVNNFKNIQLAAFKNDIEHNLASFTNDPKETEGIKTKATIQFIDETQDIRQIFSLFDEKIDVWKQFYEKAKAYFIENGHLYISPADRELLEWTRHQRKAYVTKKMGKEREAKLRAIGMDLDQEIPGRWMAMLYELKEWSKQQGALPTIDENPRLYAWMVRQRQAYRDESLSGGQIDILRGLINLEGDTRVRDRIEKLIDHFKEGDRSPNDEAIKHDLQLVKILYQKDRLSEDILVRLRSANVPLDHSINDHLWFEKVKKVLAHYYDNGTPPQWNTSLYNFCIKERRYLYTKHPCDKFLSLNKEVSAAYESFKKMITSMSKPDWDNQHAQLKQILKKDGYLSRDNCDENLLEWMWRQRRFIRDGKLSPDKIEKLLEIKGIDWHGSTKYQS